MICDWRIIGHHAEYALYAYNLQYDQRQELRQMRQQMGLLRADNAQLVEQVENVEAQNEDLQETVDELGLQLQQFQLNQGNNVPLKENPVEEEEEEEPTEIQGDSSIASGPINEPAHCCSGALGARAGS